MNMFTTRLDDKINGLLIAAAAAMLITANIGAIRTSVSVAETTVATQTTAAPVGQAPVLVASR